MWRMIFGFWIGKLPGLLVLFWHRCTSRNTTPAKSKHSYVWPSDRTLVPSYQCDRFNKYNRKMVFRTKHLISCIVGICHTKIFPKLIALNYVDLGRLWLISDTILHECEGWTWSSLIADVGLISNPLPHSDAFWRICCRRHYLFYWGFTPLSTLFQLYHGGSSLIHDPLVNKPVLG